MPPPQKPQRGRPARDHRQMLSAMLWIRATRAQWRDLPERYGPWQSVATRFYRWVAAGIWDAILAVLQQQGDAAGQLDCSAHSVDGTVIRAHQHAAGARRITGGLLSRRSARAGAASAPNSTCAERGGTPLALLVTASERHEQSAFVPLMERGAVKRPGRGRPRRRPKRVVGDKGYSGRKVRRYCRRHGIQSVIPTKGNERPHRRFDRALDRERNTVERCITRLKQYRRVATRYEKLAAASWRWLPSPPS